MTTTTSTVGCLKAAKDEVEKEPKGLKLISTFRRKRDGSILGPSERKKVRLTNKSSILRHEQNFEEFINPAERFVLTCDVPTLATTLEAEKPGMVRTCYWTVLNKNAVLAENLSHSAISLALG